MSELKRYDVDVDPMASNNPHTMAIAFVGSGHRVLEVGCASGYVTRHLVANGNEVVGVDINPAMLDEARPFLAAAHCLDLDRDLVSAAVDGTFDVVVLGDVLEHVRQPAAVLADVVSCLRPGGRCVISVPNAAHADIRLMVLEGVWAYQPDGLLDETHIRWLTRQSLGELLAECGLVAKAVRRVVVPMFGSNVPVHPELHSAGVIDFINADPDSTSYQFVIEAVVDDGSTPDALAAPPPVYPVPTDVAALRSQIDAQAVELDAWRNSRLVRYSAPLRAVYSRLRRRH